MARITHARLHRSDRGGGVRRMRVNFTVDWQLEEPYILDYTVIITLMGADAVTRDDTLFDYTTNDRSNGRDTQDSEYAFDLSTSLLNDDWGRDEVYANIIMRPQITRNIEGRTNTIQGRF